ncbi:MAG: TOBE domain-containing protein [Burkholderiales bacterium]
MDKGKIKQAASALDVYALRRDRYVAEFLGGQNVLSGKVTTVNGATFTVSGPDSDSIVVPLRDGHRVRHGETVDLAVRRDDVHLRRPEDGTPGPGWNALNARVRAVEYQGLYVKVMLDAPSGEFVAYVPDRAFHERAIPVGAIVTASWMAEQSLRLA